MERNTYYTALFQTPTKQTEYVAAIEQRTEKDTEIVAQSQIRYFYSGDRSEAESFITKPDWNDQRLREAQNAGIFAYLIRLSPDEPRATYVDDGDGVVFFKLVGIGEKA